MEIPRRKSLSHDIPPWVDPQKEIYFITVNCKDRFRNQLALSGVSGRLFETVRYRQEKLLWWPHVLLLMPDHWHALISFPPSRKPLQKVVSKWKEWTAKELGIEWQRDFFEHRLRHDESRREKADYILQNLVRKKLVAQPEDWPFEYFGDGKRKPFDRQGRRAAPSAPRSSGATWVARHAWFVPPAARGRGHRSAMSLPV